MGYGHEAATSRLLFTADMMNQIRQFSYTLDNKLASIRHFNAVNPTPDVAFSYDPYYPLLTAMKDGSGITSYGYGAVGKLGALQLVQESPPFANAAIAYQYDELGRVVARSVGGDAETVHYDALGRSDQHVDDLGTFTRSYLGQTGQLTSQSNGKVGTIWRYDTNANDRRLKQIATKGGSTYGLTFSQEGDVTGLTDSFNKLSWTYGYDKADRVISAVMSTGGQYMYGYDLAGNLATIQRPTGTTSISSNAVNEITSVNGVAYNYDLNGNLLNDYARTYKWDADGRLIAIGYIGQAGMQTGFNYDGLGRKIAINHESSVANTTTRYQWCGETLCQARDENDVSLKRYFVEGEEGVSSADSFYYGIDQLGSVRDALLASNDARVAHYDFDAYGGQIGVAKSSTDYRFAQLFEDPQSQLLIGSHREMDSLTGRWLSRDPLAESAGENLYSYADANPLIEVDPLGLQGTISTSTKRDETAARQVCEGIPDTGVCDKISQYKREIGDTNESINQYRELLMQHPDSYITNLGRLLDPSEAVKDFLVEKVSGKVIGKTIGDEFEEVGGKLFAKARSIFNIFNKDKKPDCPPQ